MTTVAIACTTGVYALLFSRLSGREGTRGKIGVARIECSNTQQQKHCEEEGDHGSAEQRDELAEGTHSITSSARASSVGGTVRPSALAVLRLIASSNLTGLCTGKSPGFSPLRMRSM